MPALSDRTILQVPSRSPLRELLKSMLAGAACTAGLLSRAAELERMRSGPRVHVLAFHRIVDDLDQLPAEVLRSLCVTTASFLRLCQLGQRHFEVLPLAEALAVLCGKRWVARDVLVLTFDDGYRDVYLRVWPILRRLGLPATVFVPTGYLDSSHPLEHDRLHALLVRARRAGLRLGELDQVPPSHRGLLEHASHLLHDARAPQSPARVLDRLLLMLPSRLLSLLGDALEARVGPPALDADARVVSSEELAALASDGIELGAHTIGHVALVHEPPGRLHQELCEPRRILGEIARRPCRAFAYCNGLWNPSLVAAVRCAGYRAAVTTHDVANRLGSDPLLLGRKTLTEAHLCGIDGRWSESRSLAQLYGLYRALGLSHVVDGRVDHAIGLGHGHGGWPWPAAEAAAEAQDDPR